MIDTSPKYHPEISAATQVAYYALVKSARRAGLPISPQPLGMCSLANQDLVHNLKMVCRAILETLLETETTSTGKP